jgi:ribosomal protein L32
MRNYINFLLSKTGEKFFTKKESSFDFECKDPNCPHCLEDIRQMEEELSTCVSCDEEKVTHNICMDCIDLMIKQNKLKL